jgi:hypothetical protein
MGEEELERSALDSFIVEGATSSDGENTIV